MKTIFLLLAAALAPLLTSAQFLAGSEARGFEREAKAPAGKVFDAAMTADMSAANGNVFQLDAFHHGKIKDAALKRHLQKYLSKPITFRLSNSQAPKRGGNTYRAVAKTASGIKLRGYWKRGGDTETLKGRDMMEVTFDEAVRRRGGVGSSVDFEVQLPPLKGFLPSVVYSVVLGTGSQSREASVSKTVSLVKVHPKGLEAKGFNLGKAHVCTPMRAGIVDPSWCKGKTIFRQGRSVGHV
mmetsp:Transcript_21882/g.36137  ORF Transcript_21882/g.36137 Transcript_21882/m.36137 type:complete len:240 (+) Transcript_21882:119-838(+)|eukprot:CAMPEP_0119013646 /NCGR_PEP_ID=MMETSP1176-20130426/8683_1 /TAXON_ID=265551 /ORGANISM="Synedropsis recta cf, Strain CCMP1620" /LENGTH=239 /DNA_ID=CAMNT_0006966751 /DNA_START=57 /DNA_END=776 /DNA_ORIENTATION=+